MSKHARAGWYRNPESSDGLRYWDGSRWTDNIEPIPPIRPLVPKYPIRSGRSTRGLPLWLSIVVFWFILAILSELLAPAIGPDASMAVALVATSTGAILLHKRRQRKSVETQQRERFREENTRAAIAQRRAAIARRRPQPRLFRTAREAEELARDWMRYLGYLDAEVTPVGADAGIDVIASEAIGQVKAQAVSTNRPVVQQTYGAAVAEGKNALVFSLAGFTSNAIDWAEDNQIALFEFNYAGEIEPSNWVASQLLDDADSQAADAGPTSTG